jgi:2,5-diketo-D-gluconate reductase A
MRYGGDFVSTWQTLEEFYREGRARSIGVSNFQPQHQRRLHGETDIIPAVNQIEAHPYLTQDDVRAFCAEHQIAVEAWSPLGRPRTPKATASRKVAQWHLSDSARSGHQ